MLKALSRFSLYLYITLYLVSCATTRKAPAPVIRTKKVKAEPTLLLPTLTHNPTDRPNDSLQAERHLENPSVQKWIAFYTTQGKGRFESILKRGALYKKQIHSILKKFGLPTNLYYLALVESEFKVEARSPVSATGIWQFMLPTARNYGLRINEYIDERRDPWRSTVAAALYLKNLNNVFDSWFLALSAYNAGESRVMNAIIRSGTRDFWQLSQIGYIPRETREYVPRFLAALLIGEHPERYGINVSPSEERNVVAIKVPTPVHLKSLAQIAGLSVAELKVYNPHILKDFTPPKFPSYRVWFPEGSNPSSEELSQLERVPTTQIQAASYIKPVVRKHSHKGDRAELKKKRHSFKKKSRRRDA